MTLFPRVVELLQEQGADDIQVIGGGIIPESDVPELKAKGTAEIFGPGSSMEDIIRYIQAHVPKDVAAEDAEQHEDDEANH